MSWQETTITQLRLLIGDDNPSSYDFTDEQLSKFIAIGTIHVDTELAKWTTVTLGPYAVDVLNSVTITPDFTTNGAPKGFAYLVVLKAACLIANSEVRRLSKTSGWKIKDRGSEIDTTAVITTAKDTASNFCNNYEEARRLFEQGSYSASLAIFSSYRSATGDIIFDTQGWR